MVCVEPTILFRIPSFSRGSHRDRAHVARALLRAASRLSRRPALPARKLLLQGGELITLDESFAAMVMAHP